MLAHAMCGTGLAAKLGVWRRSDAGRYALQHLQGTLPKFAHLVPGTCRVEHARHPSWWVAAMPVIYSVASALVCTQGLIFNKAVMVLWRMTLAGDNQVRLYLTQMVTRAVHMLAGHVPLNSRI